jgi:hypothetical protein
MIETEDPSSTRNCRVPTVSNVDSHVAPPAHKPEPSPNQQIPHEEPPHTILTEKQNILTIVLALFSAFISPVSAGIYYPALNSLAKDLHVPVSTINLTTTVYMVCQSLAPTFIGSISDRNGRRPAYMICL